MSKLELQTDHNIEFKDLAKWIFSKPPQGEKTICLNLAEESQDQYLNIASETDVILEFYVDLALEGCKILFGESHRRTAMALQFSEEELQQFVISSLTKEQFDILQKYMRSMGYKLIIKGNDDFESPWKIMENGGTVNKIRISVVQLT